MDGPQFKDSSQHLCAVCRAPAVIWCHNDEAALCKKCDSQIHSAGPLAWTHKRVALSQGMSFAQIPQMQQSHSIQDGLSARGSGESNVEVYHPEGSSIQGHVHEQQLRRDVSGASQGQDPDWNPPELVSSLANDSFEVNVLDLDDELFIGADPFMRHWDPSAPAPHKGPLPDAPANCVSALPHHPKAAQDMGTCQDGHMHCGPDTFSHGQVQEQPGPAATANAPTASSSGPPRVPSPSLQSFDNFSPALSDPMDTSARREPVVGPAPAAPSVSAGASGPAAMPAMPYYMPQPMMQPAMMWAGGNCFMPMYQHDAWATYIPATLLPRTDPAAHEAKVQERRAKRARFLEKKHQLSCRKAVRYVSRKRYADSRPRVNGRFISKNAAAAAEAAAVAAATAGAAVCDESP